MADLSTLVEGIRARDMPALARACRLIDERDAAIDSQTKMIDSRDAAIVSQTQLIDERDASLRAQETTIGALEAKVRDLKANLKKPGFFVKAAIDTMLRMLKLRR